MPKISKVSPPWMEGANASQPMLVVHMHNSELEGLDTLQGGPSIDHATGMREYSKLSPIIEIPEVRKVFKEIANEIEHTGKLSPNFQQLYELGKANSIPFRRTMAEKHNPLLELEKLGRQGDSAVALLPENVVKFFIELGHEPHINPHTNLLEFFWEVAALTAASMALGYMGSQQAHEDAEANRDAMMQHYAQQREDEREYLQKMGHFDPLETLPTKHLVNNPKFQNMSASDRKYGRFAHPAFIEGGPKFAKGGLVRSYNKGALVTGPGKGQDDKIKTSVPDGSYIIDASSTSSWGDGSTKAGSNVLKEFEEQIKRKFPKSVVKHVEKEVASHAKQVPVWLSEGEHKIDPVTVTLLGKGSNEKGAAILKKMVIDLRKHKISKGDGLPPKAKHPSAYISQGR